MRKVALIATSFRLPGTTQALFWDDLLAGRDLVTHVDPARWAAAVYLHPNKSHPGTSYTFSAGSIGDAAGFDAGFFGISPREASLMDPQQRLLLEMSWETFENAGIRPSTLRGSDCGVYIGISSADYSWRMADDLAAIDSSFATGNTASIAANRLSYLYDLRGPSMAIDTACSSSLVAFHQAYRSILSGETSQALVGAVSLHLHPLGFVSFSKASMLSRSGRCRVFDASADGYVRSEGGGVFLLKDYDLAVSDRNPILAVVAHSAVNTDGHKSGITVPSAIAQSALLSHAYWQAGLNPGDIDYIEAHGTGTAVGDPVEARALGEALARHRPKSQPLPIGSVKGNVGHLEAASGIAGLVKALFCLQHRMIPAHIGMETPNPNIPFKDLNLEVVTANKPLRPQGRLVIGVNSFGFGGANAHVILQSHVSEHTPTPALPKASAVPIIVSARDPDALKIAARTLAHFIASQPQSALYDIAHELVHGREQHAHRAVLFGRTPSSLAGMLEQYADDAPGLSGVESGTPVASPVGAAFIYSGNGAQWAGMGSRLLADPTFRASVREVDALFSRYADYSLQAELAGENGENRYECTEIAQPALFAVQVGITAMLQRRGLTPVAVAGHSVGEVAAAWASGALSLAAAVSVIHHRSALQGTTKGAGRMTAASISENGAREVLQELGLSDQLCLAGINSSCGVTLAGPDEALTTLEKALKSRGVVHLRLGLDYAFHSPAMDGLFPELRRALAHLEPEDTTVPFYSTVTGERLSGKSLDAEYWWHNIRQPVMFERAMRGMVQSGINIYLEIGPHAPLSRYIQDNLTDADDVRGRVIATGLRNDDSPQRIYSAASQALIAGAAIDWQRLLPWRGRHVRLPNYPWQREPYWHPTTSASLGLIARKYEHPLLGRALNQSELSWENELDTRAFPVLADHVVGGAIVFPGTGYAELALAAAFQWQASAVAEVEDLEIRAPLLLSAEASRTVRCAIDASDGQLTIRSREYAGNDSWTVQSVGRILREPAPTRMSRALGELPTRQPDFTARSHELLTIAAGLDYGPGFKAISYGWVEDGSALAVFDPSEQLGADLDRYYLHPALMDCAFQLIIQLLRDKAKDHDGFTFIPTRIGHLSCRADRRKPRYARARLLRLGPHSLCAEYELFDADGQAIAVLEQVRLRNVRLQRNAAEHVRYLDYAAVPRPISLPSRGACHATLARLDEALRRCFEHADVRRTQRLYAEEIDPLLDALCDRFVAQSLTSVEAASLPAGPYQSHLLNTAQVDAAYEGATSESSSAQDIWNSLIGDYPDFFPLVHAVGCVGMQLPALLQQQRPLAEVLPAHLTLATLQRHVLGESVRLQIIAALRGQIEQGMLDLEEGNRLGIIEFGAGATSYAAELCRGLDFDRADYHFVSTPSSAPEEGRRLRERYPAIAIGSFGEKSNDRRDCSLAIVTLDFHSLRDSARALEYAQSRLARGGLLLVLGQYPSHALDFIYGADPTWWNDSPEGPAQSPQRQPEYWQHYLQQIGFGHLRRYEYGSGTPCGGYALLAQRDAGSGIEAAPAAPASSRHWLLLADAGGICAQLATCVASRLSEAGDRISVATPGDAAALAQTLSEITAARGPLYGIVHLSGWGAAQTASPSALLEVQVERCGTAANLIQACESTEIDAACCLVTAGALRHLLPGRQLSKAEAQSQIVDAALAGFARTLMNEAPIGAVRLIDLEINESSVESTAALLACELRIDDAEQEIILTTGGARYAPRLRACEPPRACRADAPSTATRRALGFAVPGQLRNLHWDTVPLGELGDDDIEVSVRATGLNFRDVMYALGLLSDEGVEHGFAGPSLGLEFSGVVAKVGTRVSGFAIGDAVLGFAPSSFGDRLVTQAGALSHIPAGLSFEAAATIPSTFFTAYYSLHRLAGLRDGEKVLIHGAAGGVGIAAIQVAKWCGAEVFATAGSDEKRNFVRLLGADHVFDSRSLAFAEDILRATDGRGVDVVLNSLAGEAINRNFRVLKPFGRFLELGKRDFYENTRIGLRPFRNNISYFGIDADQLMSERPELTRQLFAEVLQLFNEHVFHALPYQTFDARDVIDAFRDMQQARQIGKLVVTYGGGIPQSVRSTNGAAERLELPASATYLVTGGLSGFGLRTAEWLADRGARNLVLLGRRGAGADEAQTVLARLERRGVHVLAWACDVTDRLALHDVLDRIARTLPPLRGIVHAATVIDDALIRDLSDAKLRRVMSPKVLGALHLDELTRSLPLDFFVLYSSATTLFGNPGQSSYIAANSVLEALSRARRAAGLPATCVQWGAIDDVGFLARSPKLKQALQDRMGGAALQSAVALDVLEAMLLSDRSDLGVLELDWRAMRRSLPSAAASKFIEIARNVAHGEVEEESSLDLQRMLRELPPEELQVALADMLRTEVGEILRIAPDKIDPARPMQEMGFDSLMGVELVVAVENRFGVRLPVLALSDSPTVAKLASWIIKQLQSEEGAATVDQGDATRAQIERIAGQHAVATPSAAEIERIATELRSGEAGANRRMIH
jgi:phthiocerol/phenolphthiocerol synthesis type-I polyketide synthase C